MLVPLQNLRRCSLHVLLALSSLLCGSFDAKADNPSLVSFENDVAPIFATHCLKCHGPKDAKSDFRIDDPELLANYLEPGDASSSSLWTDYLRSEEDDMMMPPRAHGGPLSSSQLSLINVWINEGAIWPKGVVIGTEPASPVVAAEVLPPKPLVDRVWAFQGYLHPATVHFPIALLLVGGLFVVVGFRFPILGNSVSLVCLFLGTASAIAASVMGWSFAVRQGYGGWDQIDTDSEIFWHRWSAVIVTTAAILTSIIALMALRKTSKSLSTIWKLGLLAVAAMVGAVGHQGGELTYGKTFYQDAFNELFGVDPNAVPNNSEPSQESQSGPK